MYKLNDKIRNMKPYEPLAGDYKIRMDANESFINMGVIINNSIMSAVSGLEFNRYPDPAAAKLCGLAAKKYGVGTDCITAGNGSDELISIIMSAFQSKGDTVVVSTPDFSMYEFYPQISELKTVAVPKNDDLVLEPDRILAAAKESGARLVMFSNPCNPTSTGISREEVLRIVAGTDALVVVDEAYMDFWNQSVADEICNYDNLIVLRTASKACASAALRLGFAFANPTLTDALRAVKSPYNVNGLTQAVGAVIYQFPDVLTMFSERMVEARAVLSGGLKRLAKEKSDIVRVFESKTNFVLLEMEDSERIWLALLERSIAVRRLGGYLRITAGSAEENDALLTALGEILK